LLSCPGSNLRTAATYSRGTEWASSTVKLSENIMKKPTPNPPEADTVADADSTSPYASIDTKKLHAAAERALDYYLNPGAHIMGAPYKPNAMFLANPKADTESLLANASESLSSATVMLGDFAALLEGTHRKTLLGITQVVMLGELAVNQALDNVEPAA
jgi:hypothetical protein